MSNMFSSITGLFKKEDTSTTSQNLSCPEQGDNHDSQSVTTAVTTDKSPKDPVSPKASAAKSLQPSNQQVKNATTSQSVNTSRRSSAASEGGGGLLEFPAPSGNRGRPVYRAGEPRAPMGPPMGPPTGLPPAKPKYGRQNSFDKPPFVRSDSKPKFNRSGSRDGKPSFRRQDSKADNDGAWRSEEGRSMNSAQSSKSAGAGLLGDNPVQSRASSECAWRSSTGRPHGLPDGRTHSSSPAPKFQRQPTGGFGVLHNGNRDSQGSILGDGPRRPSGASTVGGFKPPFNRQGSTSLLGEGPGPNSFPVTGGPGLLGDGPPAIKTYNSKPRFQRSATGNSILGASPDDHPLSGLRASHAPGGSRSTLPDLASLAMSATNVATHGPAGGLSRGSRTSISELRPSMEIFEPRESTASILGEPPRELEPLGINPHPSRARIGSAEPRESLPCLDNLLGALAQEEADRVKRFSLSHQLFVLGQPPPPPNSVASLSHIMPRMSYPSFDQGRISNHLQSPAVGQTPPNSISSLGQMHFQRSSVGSISDMKQFSGGNMSFAAGRRSLGALPYTEVTSMPVVREHQALSVHVCDSRDRSLDSSRTGNRDGPAGPDSTKGFRMLRNNACPLEVA